MPQFETAVRLVCRDEFDVVDSCLWKRACVLQVAVKNRLLVSNLPASATPDTLRAYFVGFGHPVREIDFGPNEKWRLPRGYAIVTLSHQDAIRKAIQDTDGGEFEGRALRVEGIKPLKSRYRSERVA